MRTVAETSAGGLVVDTETGRAAVIGRRDRRGRLLWSLPKGHIESNESIEMAALREVQEETGIEATIIVKLSDIRYWFYANKVKHSKIFHFFLMRYVSGTPTPQEGEVDEVIWVKLDEMLEMLTHVNERRLIEIAQKIVAERSSAELGFR